jgi:hypothetical protein
MLCNAVVSLFLAIAPFLLECIYSQSLASVNVLPPKYFTTFATASLTIHPQNLSVDVIPTRTPFAFSVSIKCLRDILSTEMMVMDFPKFTRNFYDNATFYKDANMSMSKVIMSPSYELTGEWIESNDGRALSPYTGSRLIVRKLKGEKLCLKDASFTLYVYKENGIGAYCGFPSSDDFENKGHGRVSNVDAFPQMEIPTIWTLSKAASGLNVSNNDTHSLDTWTGVGSGCKGNCGFGTCNYCTETCSCFEGYGASTDLMEPGAVGSGNCSLRKFFTFMPFRINNVISRLVV